MWRALTVALGLIAVLAACGDVGVGDVGVGDAGSSDAGRRLKARTVTVELGIAAERELIEEPDGSLLLGKLTDLPDVERCLVSRRPAFAQFEPFEPLDPPLCAGADNLVEGVPIDSDLVATFTPDEASGLLPAAHTLRTDAFDLRLGIFRSFRIPLLREEGLAPFIEPQGEIAPGEGVAIVWVAMGYSGPETVTGSEQIGHSGPVGNVVLGKGIELVVDPAGGAGAIELRTRGDRPLFLRLPAGSATLSFHHPVVNCRAVGLQFDTLVTGLSTDAPGVIEVPIVEGHTNLAVVDCFCAAGPDDGALLDPATCSFAPAGEDAGAP